MHLTIKESIGETVLEFDMSGDYEEVLALTSELGYCKDSTVKTDVNNSFVLSDEDREVVRELIASGKCSGINVHG